MGDRVAEPGCDHGEEGNSPEAAVDSAQAPVVLGDPTLSINTPQTKQTRQKQEVFLCVCGTSDRTQASHMLPVYH